VTARNDAVQKVQATVNKIVWVRAAIPLLRRENAVDSFMNGGSDFSLCSHGNLASLG
jgi:hypothetical protein